MSDKTSIKVATGSSGKRTANFTYLHKLFSAVALVGFLVTIIAGLMAQVGVITIVVRSVIVIVVVSLIGRVLVSIVSSYEEMNGGEA